MKAVFAILMLVVAVGCDATLQRFRNPPPTPTEQYRDRAMAYEQASELPKALLAWRISGQLDKNDADIAKNIDRIEKQISHLKKDHYQQGLELYQKGKPGEAGIELLKVLRLDPSHRRALYYLRKRLPHSPKSVYKVQAGDSFTKIASTLYHDPQKAYAVAYFNDLDPRKPLSIGTVLILPDLAPEYLYPRSDIEASLSAAEEAYTQKRLARTISLASKITAEVPGHVRARQLIEKARFEYGMELKRSGRYLAALEQLTLLPSRHKGRIQVEAEIRRLILQQTFDKKMADARTQLENGDPEGVISITEAILADNPDNAQARELRNEAAYRLGKALIDQGQEAQAIEWLEKVDPQYGDTAMQLSLARSRTKTAAEEHYRNGVKHFINEDLELAIKDWQQALDLNPDHPKARQDMENAMRLLEKWRDLEQPPPGKPTMD